MRQNPTIDTDGMSPEMKARLSKILNLKTASVMRPLTRKERRDRALKVIAKRAGKTDNDVRGLIEGGRRQQFWRKYADQYLEEAVRDKSLEEILAALDASELIGSGGKTIKKDEIYPINTADEFKEMGVHSGAAWIKSYLHKSFTPSVNNVREKIAYTQFFTRFMEHLEHAHTEEEVAIFALDAMHQIAQTIVNTEIAPVFVKKWGEIWREQLLGVANTYDTQITDLVKEADPDSEEDRFLANDTKVDILADWPKYLKNRIGYIMKLAGPRFGAAWWVLGHLYESGSPFSRRSPIFSDYNYGLSVGKGAVNTAHQNVKLVPWELSRRKTPMKPEYFDISPFTDANGYRLTYPEEEGYFLYDADTGHAIKEDGSRLRGVAAPIEHQDWEWAGKGFKTERKGGLTPLDIEEDPRGRDGPDIPKGGLIELLLTGLDNVNFGGPGYMTETASSFHTRSAFAALQDMADITGIPFNRLGRSLCFEGGNLKLAFGARGRGSSGAHFEPGQNVINMTKERGEGALGHEWMHYLDSQLGFLLMQGIRQYGRDPSHYQTIWTGKKNPHTGYYYKFHYASAMLGARSYDEALNQLPVRKLHKLVPVNEQTYEEREITKGVVSTLKELLYTMYGQSRISKGSINSFNPAARYGSSATKYAQDAFILGKTYWVTPWEMTARAYEMWLADWLFKAEPKGRKNTYLVNRGRTLSAYRRGEIKGLHGIHVIFGYPQTKYRHSYIVPDTKPPETRVIEETPRERVPVFKAMARFMGAVAEYYGICEVPMKNSTLEELLNADFIKHLTGNNALGQGDEPDDTQAE